MQQQPEEPSKMQSTAAQCSAGTAGERCAPVAHGLASMQCTSKRLSAGNPTMHLCKWPQLMPTSGELGSHTTGSAPVQSRSGCVRGGAEETRVARLCSSWVTFLGPVHGFVASSSAAPGACEVPMQFVIITASPAYGENHERDVIKATAKLRTPQRPTCQA